MSKGLTLVVVRDLLLASQIRLAASRAGAPIKIVRDPALLQNETGTALIADLNLPGAIEFVAAYKSRTGIDVVGFVSHVDTQTINHARNLGISRILARSAFFDRIDSFFQ